MRERENKRFWAINWRLIRYWLFPESRWFICLTLTQGGGGTSILGGGGGGGLGPDIKFGRKIWGKVQSSSPNKRKIWEVLLPQDTKVEKDAQVWRRL